MKTKNITRCSFALLILIISSKIALPIGFIPITFQTMAVILCGFILTRKEIVLTFTTYIIAGLCGLPIFASGGGFAYILQPSFGFILSFPIAALFLSNCSKKQELSMMNSVFVSFISLLIIYVIGASYMYFIFYNVLLLQKNLIEILYIGVFPFIMNDVISACLACLVAKRLPITANRLSLQHKTPH